MDKVKTSLAGGLLVLASVLITLASGLSISSKSELGAFPGPEISNQVFFQEGVVIGGGIFATSTSGTVVPLLASNFDKETVVDVTLNVQDATLSFPASSTISFLRNPGDTKVLFIRNATTTAAMDLTISGGTGVLLKMASSTNVAIVPGDTDGSNYAKIELIKKADKDIEALLSIFND